MTELISKNYREYHTIDKSAWGDGPWMNEPDKVQFVDEETGLPCLIVRQSSHGALCGYVGVTEDHPLYKVHYNKVELIVDVHGGLTYSNECQPVEVESIGVCHVPEPGQPDHVWWFGFDCAHAFDLAPGMRSMLRDNGLFFERDSDVYRDIDYVKEQIKELARQLHSARKVVYELE